MAGVAYRVRRREHGAKGGRTRLHVPAARRKKAMRRAIQSALAKMMTSDLGLCEIMKLRKRCRARRLGGGGGCKVVG
jgi:hypothetical protein